MARATFPVEAGAYTVDNGVLQSDVGMHLDMRDAADWVDVSTSTPTMTAGQTLGVWIKPTQVGSAGHELHPGIWSQSTGAGGFADVLSLDADGATVTSGSTQGCIWVEDDGGNIASSASLSQFTITVGEWHLVGFHLDGTNEVVEAWANGSSLGTDADFVSTSQFRINSIGYGYGDATNDGSGDKYMDDLTIFDRILTASEWSDWYNKGLHPGGALVHRYKMDDDSDTTTITDSAGTADGANNGCLYVDGNASV